MPIIESIKSLLGIGQVKEMQSITTLSMHNQIYPTYASWKDIKAFKTVEDIYTVVNRLAKELGKKNYKCLKVEEDDKMNKYKDEKDFIKKELAIELGYKIVYIWEKEIQNKYKGI